MTAFDNDVQLLPQWVQYWMDFLAVVIAISTIAFLINKQTRSVGLYLLISTIATLLVMVWMYSHLGMVRLLGIVHVVLWTPLVIYLWIRIKNDPPSKYYAILMWVLMVTFSAALVFDYYDVGRWLLGERGKIV